MQIICTRRSAGLWVHKPRVTGLTRYATQPFAILPRNVSAPSVAGIYWRELAEKNSRSFCPTPMSGAPSWLLNGSAALWLTIRLSPWLEN